MGAINVLKTMVSTMGYNRNRKNIIVYIFHKFTYNIDALNFSGL